MGIYEQNDWSDRTFGKIEESAFSHATRIIDITGVVGTSSLLNPRERDYALPMRYSLKIGNQKFQARPPLRSRNCRCSSVFLI